LVSGDEVIHSPSETTCLPLRVTRWLKVSPDIHITANKQFSTTNTNATYGTCPSHDSIAALSGSTQGAKKRQTKKRKEKSTSNSSCKPLILLISPYNFSLLRLPPVGMDSGTRFETTGVQAEVVRGQCQKTGLQTKTKKEREKKTRGLLGGGS
jgi:hypothetical protein